MKLSYKTSGVDDFKKNVQQIQIHLSIMGVINAIIERDLSEKNTPSFSFKLFHPNGKAPFWYYDNKKKQHVIAVSNYGKVDDYDVRQEYYLTETIKSILHEAGHAIFTDKDIESLSNYLKKEDVPFDILNIFEDIRQENLVSETFLTIKLFWNFPKIILKHTGFLNLKK